MRSILFLTFFHFGLCLNTPQKTRQLAAQHYKLVPYFANHYVNKYQLKTEQKRELVQYGYEGYMKACQRFDENKGFKISTYSRFWICKYMDDYIKDKMKIDMIYSLDNTEKTYCDTSEQVVIPLLEQYNLTDWEKYLLTRKFLKRETYKEIARDLNMNRNTLRTRYTRIFDNIRKQHG